MKILVVTIQYSVDVADAYSREDVWRREQSVLDEKHYQLKATVVKVSADEKKVA